MKLRLNLKDPDGVWDSLTDAGLDPNELPADVDDALTKFVQFREYVTIELDLQNGTAEVVPN